MSSQSKKPKVIVVLGPTASGKTGLAVFLARQLGGEIISADSRQVYRQMDIGTGKDLIDYAETAEGLPAVPYHLLDVAEPAEQYDLASYQRQAKAAIDDCLRRGRQPIVCGGSGLYLQALVDGYQLPAVKPDDALRQELETYSLAELQQRLQAINPSFFAKVNQSDAGNKRRLIRYIEVMSKVSALPPKIEPDYEFLLLGLRWPREVLNQRIEQRLRQRLAEQNMVAEIESLNQAGLSWARLERFGLEYAWIARYLQGKLDYEQMFLKLYTEICRFAKRQMTWFQRWEKQGAAIRWLEAPFNERALAWAREFLGR